VNNTSTTLTFFYLFLSLSLFLSLYFSVYRLGNYSGILPEFR